MWYQILRYNHTTAYDTHMDWIGSNSMGTENTDHDYDSAVVIQYIHFLRYLVERKPMIL